MMITIALLIGFIYGYISVKGQFCMNSGFSNVVRKKDTTKLKSFVVAILIQMLVLPLIFTLIYLYEPTRYLVGNLSLPPLYLVGNAVGGFLFGVFMYYTAGCGAGVFFKMGEKNAGAVIAAIGFMIGAYLTEKSLLQPIREIVQNVGLVKQEVIWKEESALLISALITLVAGLILLILYKRDDSKPSGAVWGWKKTGVTVGVLGVLGWLSAILANSSYGMAIIPGAIDLIDFNYTWGLMFVVGIPIGAFLVSYNNGKKFVIPKTGIVLKRLLGGLGLGISGSIAGGCTVGHGLTFSPLLGIGSLIALLFIFMGSGLMGYLTRK